MVFLITDLSKYAFIILIALYTSLCYSVLKKRDQEEVRHGFRLQIQMCIRDRVEEVLYPAMEDFAIDIVIGKGASARSIRLDLPHFTLIGATTRAGLLTAPLRDRFGVVHHLEFYTDEELQLIVEKMCIRDRT